MQRKQKWISPHVIVCLLTTILLSDLHPLQAQDQVRTRVLPARIQPATLPPGRNVTITYRWDAVPMGKDYSVFVHFRNEQGEIIWQGDHSLPWPTVTSSWSGHVSYSRHHGVPKDAAEGIYRVVVGLYDGEGRAVIAADENLRKLSDTAFVAGTFTVDKQAPEPPLASDKPPTLDLSGYEITFRDEFDRPLDVSAWGPGTRWIAHTPYGGDFGDAIFTDPEEGFPFRIHDGILTIEARKENGEWRSGLLCSVDPEGKGFSQKFGYFEMRAQFPEGPGTWPAFWLLTTESLTNDSITKFEVDIVEQYGRRPQYLHTVVHWWYPDGRHKSAGDQFRVEDMTEGFHRYGFLWDEHQMIWYFDGVEIWRRPTPEAATREMYVLLNLALGAGWPIESTPNPSVMKVDYVRVYARKTSEP